MSEPFERRARVGRDEKSSLQRFDRHQFNLLEYQFYRKIIEKCKIEELVEKAFTLACLQPEKIEENCISELNDESIRHELDSIFGPMNYQHNEFNKYYEEYKRCRVEMIDKAMVEYENYLMPDAKPRSSYMSVVDKLFACEELDSFDLNPFTNKCCRDYFILPRHSLTWRSNIVYNLNRRGDTESEPTTETFVRVFDGLGVYDPKFDGKYNLVCSSRRGVSRAFMATLSEYLAERPNGIALSVFYVMYNQDTERQLDYQPYGYFTPKEMFEDLPDAGWIQSSSNLPAPLDEVVFPSSLRGLVVNVEVALKRLWHAYRCHLASQKEPVVLEESWCALVKLLGLRVDEFTVRYWGFDSLLAFVKYCNRLFRSKDIHILVPISLDDDESDQTAPKFYAYYGTYWKFSSKFKIYTEQEPLEPSVSELEQPHEFPIPEWGIKEWVTKIIQPGQTFLCFFGLGVRPDLFSLVMALNIQPYLDFRKAMTQYYKKNTNLTRGSFTFVKKLRPEEFIPGTLVSVYYGTYWRRAQVIKLLNREKCRLYLLDAGLFDDLLIKYVRSLLPEFKFFPAQGILCRLDLGDMGVADNYARKHRLRALSNMPVAEHLEVVFLHQGELHGIPIWTVMLRRMLVEHKNGEKHWHVSEDLNRTLSLRVNLMRQTSPQPSSFIFQKVKSNNGGFGRMLKVLTE